jgi:GNAT superfamily N-acetyltransferase
LALRIEPLGKAHDRASFRSGAAAIDTWFAQRAGQDARRNVARVFLAVDSDEPRRVLGFYSLGAYTISIDDLPDEAARKLPRYDAIPAALIGRLARSETDKGKKMGALLLADALRRVTAAAETLAVYAIVVDAKDARAAAFYRSFGFMPFPLHANRLFLPTSTVRTALRHAGEPAVSRDEPLVPIPVGVRDVNSENGP